MEQTKSIELGKVVSAFLLNVYLLEKLKVEIIKRLPTFKKDEPLFTELWSYYIFLYNQNMMIESKYLFKNPVLNYVILDSETDPYIEDLRLIFKSAQDIIEEKYMSIKDEESLVMLLKNICDLINKLTGSSITINKDIESQSPSR